jgi:glycosyltransferase involved in cell wall biosynthesis
MNVGIDFTSILYKRGVSRYTHNLIKELSIHPQVELSLYGASLRQHASLERYLVENGFDSYPHAVQKLAPTMQSWLWRFGLNPVSNQLQNLDVFHSWDWIQPPDRNVPLVSTIHDLAILKFPETAHPKILAMHKRAWNVLKKREAHIIAISQATKKDVLELLEIPSERVHVVYEALPTETEMVNQSLSEEKTEQLKQKYKLNQKFILFVGTTEPRKNLERLIEAWIPLSKDYQLLIAGKQGWDQSHKLLTRVPAGQLRFLGKVSDQLLSVLYAEAELLAYPSLYEGFGLPILEAFHHGTPVVTSNISSMPEVAGNAAELVNPMSVESIQKGLETVLGESALEQKTRLQKMIIRLHSFSWKRVADETVSVYNRAIQERE